MQKFLVREGVEPKFLARSHRHKPTELYLARELPPKTAWLAFTVDIHFCVVCIFYPHLEGCPLGGPGGVVFRGREITCVTFWGGWGSFTCGSAAKTFLRTEMINCMNAIGTKGYLLISAF